MPAVWSARASCAAVTPEPHDVPTGVSRCTPAAAARSRTSSAGRKRPSGASRSVDRQVDRPGHATGDAVDRLGLAAEALRRRVRRAARPAAPSRRRHRRRAPARSRGARRGRRVSGVGTSRGHRQAGRAPGVQAAVEHPHLGVGGPPQHPPGAARGERGGLVVDDDLVVVADTAGAQGRLEHGGVGQRMPAARPGRAREGRVEVEVRGPGEVRGGIQLGGPGCRAGCTARRAPSPRPGARRVASSSAVTRALIGPSNHRAAGRPGGGCRAWQHRCVSSSSTARSSAAPSGRGTAPCSAPTSSWSCPTCPRTARGAARSSPGRARSR